MKRFTILCFFGTRPEAIKMAPVVQALKKEKRFRVVTAVSAQHRDMLDQVLKSFKLRADIDFNLMKKGQSLFDITATVLRKFESVLKRVRPDLVLVHGDTSTTLAGSLASFYMKIPVGHVEAGLRTRDKYRPFPEEINRRVTDSIATLYFSPTAESRQHLLRESLDPKYIFVTGNTVIDALLTTARKISLPTSHELQHTLKKIGSQQIILLTAHRRENFGPPFVSICKAIKNLSIAFPTHHWIYPVHPNPHVQKPVFQLLKGRRNIHLMDPLTYPDLVHVMKRSILVVTDSGGLQEEAPSLAKPVVVLREVTERPEAVRAGTVILVGSNQKTIERTITTLLNNRKKYWKMARAVNPYGDGHASERIAQAIRWFFGISGRRPRPFGRNK